MTHNYETHQNMLIIPPAVEFMNVSPSTLKACGSTRPWPATCNPLSWELPLSCDQAAACLWWTSCPPPSSSTHPATPVTTAQADLCPTACVRGTATATVPVPPLTSFLGLTFCIAYKWQYQRQTDKRREEGGGGWWRSSITLDLTQKTTWRTIFYEHVWMTRKQQER